MKRTPGDIIIWHEYTKNQDHMLYCSWDIVCDGCNCYLSFWTIFSPFTPLTAQKVKISKKWKIKKTPGNVIILHKCIKNHDHILYCYWDMVHDGRNYFSFWAIFCLFTPLIVWKMKIKKEWKKRLEISSFYTCVP